ncbi:hypothetical protein EMCRGX_G009573 [Ephydatia muelleri]|eukprot:Em0003g778a
MISIGLSDMQKIGLGLVLFGLGFLTLGVLLIFDKALLAMGNLMFVAGIGCIIGPQRTYQFFFQTHKLKGTLFFFGGILVVLVGWPLVGMLLEMYGAFLLFGGLLPHVVLFLRRAPVIGHVLNMPGIKLIVDRIADDSKSPA